MIDNFLEKLWEIFTSDDKTDRLVMRIILAVFVVLIFLFFHFFSLKLLIMVVLIAGALVITGVILHKAEKRTIREAEELEKAEIADEDSYIKVRPEEIDPSLAKKDIMSVEEIRRLMGDAYKPPLETERETPDNAGGESGKEN